MNRLMQHLYQSLQQLWRRLLSRLRRGRYEREMEEEMRFHLEMQIEQNIDAGMAAEEARYAARRQVGNQTWLKYTRMSSRINLTRRLCPRSLPLYLPALPIKPETPAQRRHCLPGRSGRSTDPASTSPLRRWPA
jgi:hypothetical protein